MSLVVSAFWHDPETGDPVDHTDWDEGHHMAGPEVARSELWGSDAVRLRGANFLPRLADSDLWVGPEELGGFEAEVRKLLIEAGAISIETGWSEDILRHYLSNFLRAIQYARPRGGGVSIE
jgi:hypothetical protein